MTKPQACRLSSVWMTWTVVPTVAVMIGVTRGWWLAFFVTAVAVVAEFAYVRAFPYLSAMLGYGSVEDVKPPAATVIVVPRVTFYSALGCPFCPIVRRRLEELQRRLGFELVVEDVTFRPQRLTEKGLRSVPVVEAGGHFLVGHATSDAIAAFLKDAT
jgi:glutaredoxin